jgi:hypothetical protein
MSKIVFQMVWMLFWNFASISAAFCATAAPTVRVTAELT